MSEPTPKKYPSVTNEVAKMLGLGSSSSQDEHSNSHKAPAPQGLPTSNLPVIDTHATLVEHVPKPEQFATEEKPHHKDVDIELDVREAEKQSPIVKLFKLVAP